MKDKTMGDYVKGLAREKTGERIRKINLMEQISTDYLK